MITSEKKQKGKKKISKKEIRINTLPPNFKFKNKLGEMVSALNTFLTF